MGGENVLLLKKYFTRDKSGPEACREWREKLEREAERMKNLPENIARSYYTNDVEYINRHIKRYYKWCDSKLIYYLLASAIAIMLLSAIFMSLSPQRLNFLTWVLFWTMTTSSFATVIIGAVILIRKIYFGAMAYDLDYAITRRDTLRELWPKLSSENN